MDLEVRSVGFKILLDAVFLALPALFGITLTIFVDPFERGFFCNDENLSYPFKENTVSTAVHALIFSLTGSFIIIAVEIIRAKRNLDSRDKNYSLTLFNRRIPLVVEKLYQYLGIFYFIASVNQFFTDIIKHSVGRLRPHFYDVCMPEMPDGSTCNDAKNHFKYIEDFICTNRDSTAEWHMKNMRLSFPSGHTSSAFALATYISIYMQARITWRGSKLLKHFLQIIFVAAAAFVGLTRISDYAHHWSDVLASLLIGTTLGGLFGIFATDLVKKKKLSSIL